MRYLLPGFIAFAFLSCDTVSAPPEEVPKAFEQQSASGKRLGGKGGDVINEMYDEVVSKDATLKALEKDIDDMPEMIADATAPFHAYNRNNENYYTSAARHVGYIKDSALREKIRTMIDNSKSNYNKSIASHQRLINDINWKQVTLSDLHSYLMLVKTLPEIESYQKKNLPATAPLEKISAEHDRLNERTKEAGNR